MRLNSEKSVFAQRRTSNGPDARKVSEIDLRKAIKTGDENSTVKFNWNGF